MAVWIGASLSWAVVVGIVSARRVCGDGYRGKRET